MSLNDDELRSSQYVRPNDDWQTQPAKTPGVAVEDDAEIRKSSLRRKRRIFTIGFTAFSMGALLILFNSPIRSEFLAPGPLSSSHAQILKGQGADRCSACHDAGHQSIAGWVATLFKGSGPDHLGQSEKCMECHSQTIDPALAILPHNQNNIDSTTATPSKFQMASFSKKLMDKNGQGQTIRHANEIACRACHREHHGKSDLKILTDRQCQTCHSDVYHSFESDHPEFDQWPFAMGSAIAFDHSSHSGKHFPEKGEKFECAQCHVDDNFKNVKLLNAYATSCARCHDQAIKVNTQQGLAMIALPMLDVEALKEAKLDVGLWPESAVGDFDGAIPDLMRVLLAADNRGQEALLALGSDFQFADVEPADSKQLKHVGEVVWAIKRLLVEIGESGPTAIRARLEKVAGRALDEPEWDLLSATMNPTVFKDAVALWMPELEKEIAGSIGELPFANVADIPDAKIFANMRQDDQELLAPNPLKDLMKSKSRPNAKPEIRNVENPGPVAKTPASSKLQDKVQTRDTQSSQIVSNPNGEVLVENPLKGLTTGDQVEQVQLPKVTHIRPPSETGPEAATNDAQAMFSTGLPDQVSSSPVARQGWHRDDNTFQIRYQPAGHADSFLEGWLGVLASIPNADKNDSTRLAFKRITSLNGPGLCRSCHTMEWKQDASFVVNWMPRYRDPSIRSFTRFSHGSHLTQPELRDCKACHELDLTKPNATSFVDFDSATKISNFRAIMKADCASCHRDGQTNSSCTQCHSYHVGSRVMGAGN